MVGWMVTSRELVAQAAMAHLATLVMAVALAPDVTVVATEVEVMAAEERQPTVADWRALPVAFGHSPHRPLLAFSFRFLGLVDLCGCHGDKEARLCTKATRHG